MSWTAKEVVALPVLEEREVHKGISAMVATGESVRKEPGDKISKKEMDEAGQSADDIASLVKSGAIEEN